VMAAAEEAWRRELASVTFADLMATVGRDAAAAQARARVWLATASGADREPE
jgi:DNA-binding IscR family transcriptional regulator